MYLDTIASMRFVVSSGRFTKVRMGSLGLMKTRSILCGTSCNVEFDGYIFRSGTVRYHGLCDVGMNCKVPNKHPREKWTQRGVPGALFARGSTYLATVKFI